MLSKFINKIKILILIKSCKALFCLSVQQKIFKQILSTYLISVTIVL